MQEIELTHMEVLDVHTHTVLQCVLSVRSMMLSFNSFARNLYFYKKPEAPEATGLLAGVAKPTFSFSEITICDC